MFNKRDLNIFEKRDYFEIYKLELNEIIVKSNNTGHYWKIECSGNNFILYHKHHLYDLYHLQRVYCNTSLKIIRRYIISHDIYQMNDRKEIEKQFMKQLVAFYN